MRPAPYHRLSIAAKQAATRLTRTDEPPVTCPHCEAHTPVAELLEHVNTRCPGLPPPHPRSRWLDWREAGQLGVSHSTLSFWARRGEIRVTGTPDQQRYLLRDLAMRIARRRRPRRATNKLEWKR